jgi:O-antigen ligase
VTGRLEAQHLALIAWAESPVWGKGTGSTAFVIGGGDQPGLGVINGVYPHNVTVELLAELGLMGALLYLITILGLLFKGARALKAMPGSSEAWMLLVLIGLVTQAFATSQTGMDLTLDNGVWILAALLAVAIGEPRTRSSMDVIGARDLSAGLTASGPSVRDE